MFRSVQWFIEFNKHHDDVITGAKASRITSLTVVSSTVYLDTDQRKYQSSASLAFVWGIHRRPVNSPHKWPVTRKMFPFDDVIKIQPPTTPLISSSLDLNIYPTYRDGVSSNLYWPCLGYIEIITSAVVYGMLLSMHDTTSWTTVQFRKWISSQIQQFCMDVINIHATLSILCWIISVSERAQKSIAFVPNKH